MVLSPVGSFGLPSACFLSEPLLPRLYHWGHVPCRVLDTVNYALEASICCGRPMYTHSREIDKNMQKITKEE
jgi:hypothetical protein